MNRASAGILLACALGMMMLNACILGEKEAYIIPPKETAEQQYLAAVKHREEMLKIPSREKTKQYSSIIEAFEAVPKRFPKDEKFTPLARLEIANCYFELKQYPKALRLYKAAQKEYSANDLVQAHTLLAEGQCYEAQRDTRKAVDCYRRCSEQYAGQPDERIQKIVARAKELSNRILPVSPK
jgi:tetratricopeptide (TPR) repeat protein